MEFCGKTILEIQEYPFQITVDEGHLATCKNLKESQLKSQRVGRNNCSQQTADLGGV